MRLFTAFSAICLALVVAGCSQQQNDLRQLPAEPSSGTAIASTGVTRSPHTRFTQLYDFDGTIGAHPVAPLVEFGGLLYGTALTGGACCGSVFSVDPNHDVTKVVHSFSHADGAYPMAGLTVLNGLLYGTTTTGGAHFHHGTVFSVDPATGAEHVVHSFAGGADGARPEAGLIAANGLLYGTTAGGGASGLGTVFDVNPATGAAHVLHSFSGADGKVPKANLIFVNGRLYGTTYEGGDCCGTIFELNPSTKTLRTVFKFNGGAPGGYPRAGLIAVNGRLYGTTERGGNSDGIAAGNVFEFDPSTGLERNIFSFGHESGTLPYAGVTFMGGKLYGTTYHGGDLSGCRGSFSGCGTVFELSLDGTERVLVRFTGGNGKAPEAGLIALNGRLYGTTSTGGTGAGSVFEVLP